VVDDVGAARELSTVLTTGAVRVETSYRTKDGRKIPMLFSASVMYDAHGKSQGIVCVAQDISERKQAETRLRTYSDELAEINEELKNFAYIVSPDLRAPLNQ
jgi:signal transduction histidine kinase